MGLFKKTSPATQQTSPVLNKVPDSARLDLISAELEDFKSRHSSIQFRIFLSKAIEQLIYAKMFLKAEENKDE